MKSLRATLQLICTDEGPNERAALTLQIATFKLDTDRDELKAALQHAGSQLAICVGFERASRLPVGFEEVEIEDAA